MGTMQEVCQPGKSGPGRDGMECPGVCPVKCGPEETFCDGGFDPNNCKMSDRCIPFAHMPGKDGNECPEICPKNCEPDGIMCPGGKDDNDCMVEDFCIPKDDPNGCPPPKM